MMGDKIHFIMSVRGSGDYNTLRYIEFDFSNGNFVSVLLHEHTYYFYPKTVFMGSGTRSAGGITMYESYTAVSMNYFELSSGGTQNYDKEYGAILPTILTNSCMKDQSGDVENFVSYSKTPFMGFDEQEFGANIQDNYSESTTSIKSYDFIGNQWVRDSFCSNFPAAPALVNGSVDANICFRYNDVENTYPFTPITHPSCTDTGIMLTYEVHITGTSFQPRYLKLNIDPYANVIRWTGLTGGSEFGQFTLTITGTMPDG